MGKLKRAGYTKLDALVAEHGLDWIHERLMDGLFSGKRPSEIAREEFGLPYVVLKGYIEKHCAEDVELAYRARADELEWEATEAVRGAEVENVAVARLQSDHFMKLAGKLDRGKWGDKGDASSASGITVVVQRGGSLTVVSGEDKGYPAGIPAVEMASVIEGEVIEGDSL